MDKFGTYDSKGVFHQQKVHLGQLRTGKWGLFTGNFLAWPLDNQMTEVEAQILCTRIGFEFVPAKVGDKIVHDALC